MQPDKIIIRHIERDLGSLVHLSKEIKGLKLPYSTRARGKVVQSNMFEPEQ